MRITATQPLFAWATLEDSPSLETVRRCLEAIPDASLLQGLRQARGHGRDDYPVSVLWGVAVLTPLLRHPSYDGCLAELRRNPTLCRLLGVETEAQIPHHWNLSRFLDVWGILPIWPRCGSVSTPWFGGWPVWCPIWGAAPQGTPRRERPPRRSGTSASRGEAGTATAGRRPQGVSRRRGEGGESCGVVRLQAPPLGRRPS